MTTPTTNRSGKRFRRVLRNIALFWLALIAIQLVADSRVGQLYIIPWILIFTIGGILLAAFVRGLR